MLVLLVRSFEVVEIRNVTILPGTQEVLHGLTTIEGQTIPVINLRRLLGQQDVKTLHLAVVLRDEDLACVIALPVDEVLGTREVQGILPLSGPTTTLFGDATVVGIPVKLLQLQALLSEVEDRLGLEAV